jgi:hypothetical protein
MSYIWRVTGLRDYPEEAGSVYYAAWDLTKTGKTEGYINGEVPLIEWLPYNELTQEVLIGWVQDIIGPGQVKAYEQNL